MNLAVRRMDDVKGGPVERRVQFQGKMGLGFGVDDQQRIVVSEVRLSWSTIVQ